LALIVLGYKLTEYQGNYCYLKFEQYFEKNRKGDEK